MAFMKAFTNGGGGSDTLNLKFCPVTYGVYKSGLIFETSKVKHIKSNLSDGSDSANCIWGYSDTPSPSQTLNNTFAINGADADVSTTYAYLIGCATGNAYSMTYDVEVTFR